jgi:hypothetical protein
VGALARPLFARYGRQAVASAAEGGPTEAGAMDVGVLARPLFARYGRQAVANAAEGGQKIQCVLFTLTVRSSSWARRASSGPAAANWTMPSRSTMKRCGISRTW